MRRTWKRWMVRERENRRLLYGARPRRSWCASVALFICLPVVCALSWSFFVGYVERHPYFTVREFIVDENVGFSQDDVQEWSGISVGMSMWDVDPAQVKSQLLSHSWIQSAQVRRDFPQRVHVSISVRRPVAIVLHEGLMYLDESGSCFKKPAKSPAVDLPYVSGFAGASLDAPGVRSALEGVLRLLSLSHLWQESLSEIHWDERQGYTLFLEQRRVTIHLGWETAPEKFVQIGAALAEWPHDAPAAVFDARFAGQIVVRPYAEVTGEQRRALSRSL